MQVQHDSITLMKISTNKCFMTSNSLLFMVHSLTYQRVDNKNKTVTN